MLREAALGEARVPSEDVSHAADLGQVDAQSDDPHDASKVAPAGTFPSPEH
jgi:hypothetical protein